MTAISVQRKPRLARVRALQLFHSYDNPDPRTRSAPLCPMDSSSSRSGCRPRTRTDPLPMDPGRTPIANVSTLPSTSTSADSTCIQGVTTLLHAPTRKCESHNHNASLSLGGPDSGPVSVNLGIYAASQSFQIVSNPPSSPSPNVNAQSVYKCGVSRFEYECISYVSLSAHSGNNPGPLDDGQAKSWANTLTRYQGSLTQIPSCN